MNKFKLLVPLVASDSFLDCFAIYVYTKFLNGLTGIIKYLSVNFINLTSVIFIK